MNRLPELVSASGFNCPACWGPRLAADTVRVPSAGGSPRLPRPSPFMVGADGEQTNAPLVTEEGAVDNRREDARCLADALREKGVYGRWGSIRGLRSPTRFRLRCAPGSSKGSPQQRRGSSGGKRASVEGFRVVDAILSGFRGTSELLAALLRHLTSAPADRPRSNRAAKSYLATPTQGPGACPWERATLRNPAITTSSPRSSRMTTARPVSRARERSTASRWSRASLR